LTFELMTPSNLRVAFSTVCTHDAHVMPFTANVFSSTSVDILYPALSTAAWISCSDKIFSSKLIFNFSVAKLTLDSCTPGNFLVAFSTSVHTMHTSYLLYYMFLPPFFSLPLMNFVGFITCFLYSFFHMIY